MHDADHKAPASTEFSGKKGDLEGNAPLSAPTVPTILAPVSPGVKKAVRDPYASPSDRPLTVSD